MILEVQVNKSVDTWNRLLDRLQIFVCLHNVVTQTRYFRKQNN